MGVNRGGGPSYSRVRGGMARMTPPAGPKVKKLSYKLGGKPKVHDRVYVGAQKPSAMAPKVQSAVAGMLGKAQRLGKK